MLKNAFLLLDYLNNEFQKTIKNYSILGSFFILTSKKIFSCGATFVIFNTLVLFLPDFLIKYLQRMSNKQ